MPNRTNEEIISDYRRHEEVRLRLLFQNNYFIGLVHALRDIKEEQERHYACWRVALTLSLDYMPESPLYRCVWRGRNPIMEASSITLPEIGPALSTHSLISADTQGEHELIQVERYSALYPVVLGISPTMGRQEAMAYLDANWNEIEKRFPIAIERKVKKASKWLKEKGMVEDFFYLNDEIIKILFKTKNPGDVFGLTKKEISDTRRKVRVEAAKPIPTAAAIFGVLNDDERAILDCALEDCKAVSEEEYLVLYEGLVRIYYYGVLTRLQLGNLILPFAKNIINISRKIA